MTGLRVDGKDRKLLLGAGAVFILLVVAALIFGKSEAGQAESASSYASNSGGAKAAFLLLTDTGYKVQRWEKPLSELPTGANATLVVAEPEEAPSREERDRLKAFVSEGGRVIATGMFAGTFLPENHSVPDLFEGMTWKKASALSPSPITRAAPQIVLAPRAFWSSGAAPLYGDGNHVYVVKYPYGKGEVLWWASATPLTNAGLREPGNLEFFLACLGDSTNEILWDEYIHGYRKTLTASIAASPAKWLFVQLLLLAIAVVATFSRRSGPMYTPAAESRLSPLEFVETLGGLYQRAGSSSVAVDICYRRFRYWLTRRLGVASNMPATALAATVRERLGLDNDDFLITLQKCEAASSDVSLQPQVALRLLQNLDKYATQLHLFQGIRKEKR